jgi:serine/threonine protein kinase
MNIKVITLPSSPIHIDYFYKSEWDYIATIYNERNTIVHTYIHREQKHIGALKIYSKEHLSEKEVTTKRKYIVNEIMVHKILDGSKHIVPLWFYYETENEWGLMTKYMHHNTLISYIYKYKSEYCILKEVVIPLLKGLQIIHHHSIVHRDLKSENIFIHKNNVYIGDFGYALSLSKESEKPHGIVGTLQYMAPELLYAFLDLNHTIVNYGYEVDIWALGVIVYELLFHRKPFHWSGYRNISSMNPSNPDFIKERLNMPLVFPYSISKEAAAFIRACLQNDPEKRPMVTELLEHPWIINYLRTRRDSNETCPIELNLILTPKEASIAKNSTTKMQKTSPWKTQCTIS